MKKIIGGLYSVVVIFICISACSKNNSKTPSSGGNAALTISESTIKRGQPLVAATPQGFSSSNLSWKVNPSSSTHISSSNDQAMILVASPGTYQVVAVNAGSGGNDSSTATITVTDEVYTPVTTNFDTVSLAGDKVTLTPVADAVSGLLFLAQSEKSYDCFPTFIYSMEEVAGGAGIVAIHFSSVVSGSLNGNCNGAKNPATSYLLPSINGKLPVGDYPFSVSINNSTYHGSLAVTDTDYSFTWNDESEVIISPKQIKKK